MLEHSPGYLQNYQIAKKKCLLVNTCLEFSVKALQSAPNFLNLQRFHKILADIVIE